MQGMENVNKQTNKQRSVSFWTSCNMTLLQLRKHHFS